MDELTDRTIAALGPREERYEVPDGREPGLRLRVYPSGARAFSYWYRNDKGEARRHKLGAYPELTLARARKRARALSVRVDAGEDPEAEKQKARVEARARRTAATFADVCRAFAAEELPTFRPATRAGWQRYIDVEIIPRLGKKAPRDLTADDVADLKDRIARGDRNRKAAPVSARRCFEVLRRILDWASVIDPDVNAARRRHGIERLEINPAAAAKGYRRKKRRGKTRADAAQKAFTDDQLRALFSAADSAIEAAAAKARARAPRRDGRALEPFAHEVEARAFANLLGLVARTAVRAHDARAARWDKIDEARKQLWTIPQHKTSDHTGAPHVVPLSKGALGVLARIRDANAAAGAAKSPWLFPADTTDCEVCERAGHVDKDSKAARRLKADAGLDGRGLLHRLRDTFKTRASEHGIASRVSEAILAHVPPGIEGTYDHAELLPDRRKALEWWSAELAQILSGEERKGADVVAIGSRA